MEFNDSQVSDYKFENLDSEVSGEEVTTNQFSGYGGYGGGGFWGGKYGTSAYMLFYERIKKKDIKLVVPEDQVEEEKNNGVEVTYNADKKEYTKMVDYRKSAENEAPSKIYERIFKENKAFGFETDVYSKEFFGFLLQVMTRVSEFEGNNDRVKLAALNIGKKAGFEILAKCAANDGIKDVSQVMIDILKTSDELCATFMRVILDDYDAHDIWEILIDGKSEHAQKHVARVIKFLLCKLKMTEKDLIEAETMETVNIKYTDEDDVEQEEEKTRPKSLAL